MRVTNKHFGSLNDGHKVNLFSFECSSGMNISITNFGGIITSIKIPDRNGSIDEIAAGFTDLQAYLEPHPYFGAIIGRFANRISESRFNIDGQIYQLTKYNEHFQLHGGDKGFDKKLWDYSLEEKQNHAVLNLKYFSRHMEEGYPGNLSAEVDYIIYDENKLEIRYRASTDLPTHVNLTNHTYFNLSGFKESIAQHELQLRASNYLELNENQIPTGKFIPCSGSAFDFRDRVKLGDLGIPEHHDVDHCFVLSKNIGESKPDAILYHPGSGRKLNMYCSQPGIQIYTGNFLDGSLVGHGGIAYGKHMAICLETQHFPDSPNNNKFPSTLLMPWETYAHQTTICFTNE